jgi:TRAP-type C4-dicarboxylate transport system substrate-binding protein
VPVVLLAQAVQGGTIQCAQHSLSNFAPFASAVDLINLPYFCGSNQRFTNLTSDTWKSEVHPKIEASGFKALFYIVIDPRVVAVRQGGNVGHVAGDMAGVKFRVPGSAMLQQYYRMVGATRRRWPGAKPRRPSSRAWPMRSIRRSARCMSSASRTSSAT